MFPTLMPFVVYRLCPENFVFSSIKQTGEKLLFGLPMYIIYEHSITFCCLRGTIAAVFKDESRNDVVF